MSEPRDGTPRRDAAIERRAHVLCVTLLALLALPGIRLSEAAWREWVFQAVFQGLLIGVVSLYVYSNALARIVTLPFAPSAPP